MTWCLSVYSYIKPQHDDGNTSTGERCLSVYSYIKPQHGLSCYRLLHGVYLSIPTSNHNKSEVLVSRCVVFICLFLHQTTTLGEIAVVGQWCLSVYSYIKPQPISVSWYSSVRCLSVYSYIKPQHKIVQAWGYRGVYLSIPTSNHNLPTLNQATAGVFICLFLHQTTTLSILSISASWCLSVYSYIKPQLRVPIKCNAEGVYLSIPTSNHNYTIHWIQVPAGVYLSIPTSNHNRFSLHILNSLGVYLSIPTSNHN